MPLTRLEYLNHTLYTLQSLLKEGHFRTEEDIYTYLVGCPVTETAILTNKHKKSLFELRTYFLLLQEQQRRQTQSSYFSAVSGPHWIHVEARFENAYIDYQDLIKLYIPLEYKELYHQARTIFDYLFSLKKRFCYKITYKNRQDTLCLWVTRSALEEVIEFLQSLTENLLPAPTFCPTYRSIGITRELTTSFNDIIASTLFEYLQIAHDPNLAGYIDYLEQRNFSKTSYFNSKEFDTGVVVRSLKCILYNNCPVTSQAYTITDFNG